MKKVLAVALVASLLIGTVFTALAYPPIEDEYLRSIPWGGMSPVDLLCMYE